MRRAIFEKEVDDIGEKTGVSSEPVHHRLTIERRGRERICRRVASWRSLFNDGEQHALAVDGVGAPHGAAGPANDLDAIDIVRTTSSRSQNTPEKFRL